MEGELALLTFKVELLQRDAACRAIAAYEFFEYCQQLVKKDRQESAQLVISVYTRSKCLKPLALRGRCPCHDGSSAMITSTFHSRQSHVL